jgi:acyl-CoA reductase-like NAD-dependent aldehyde dehydrogenase
MRCRSPGPSGPAAVRTAATANGLRVQAEMGGVNGLIVLADADLDNAVDRVINGAFFAAGPRDGNPAFKVNAP